MQTEQPAPQPVTPGKVFGPGTVEHDPKLWYIIIASTPEPEVAKRNAAFLASNGIDVSIETRRGTHTSLYTLISANGFPTLVEAEAYKKRIVEIGHKTLDFQKTRRAWDDAYPNHVRPAAPAK